MSSQSTASKTAKAAAQPVAQMSTHLVTKDTDNSKSLSIWATEVVAVLGQLPKSTTPYRCLLDTCAQSLYISTFAVQHKISLKI